MAQMEYRQTGLIEGQVAHHEARRVAEKLLFSKLYDLLMQFGVEANDGVNTIYRKIPPVPYGSGWRVYIDCGNPDFDDEKLYNAYGHALLSPVRIELFWEDDGARTPHSVSDDPKGTWFIGSNGSWDAMNDRSLDQAELDGMMLDLLHIESMLDIGLG
jgi:hypothetical protein